MKLVLISRGSMITPAIWSGDCSNAIFNASRSFQWHITTFSLDAGSMPADSPIGAGDCCGPA